MAKTQNKTLIFKKIPDGFPVAGEHLAIEDRPTDLSAPPPEGGLVAEVIYVAFDPYQRGRMRDAKVKSYVPAFSLDGPISNSAIVRVLSSAADGFAKGDIVRVPMCPTAEYAVVTKEILAMGASKIDTSNGVDPVHYLGMLGMPGLTAYCGFYDIGKPKKGETLFVSSAAGAVGQVVGQLAKAEGLTVIGSVGADEKLDFITKELGFDAGFNYKKEKPHDALKRLAPNGIDIYFENVGGDHLEAALENMNELGRIPVCGMIAEYNTPKDKQPGVRNLFYIIGKMLTLKGFLQRQYGPEWRKEFQEKVSKLIADGKCNAKVHVTEGIDNAAQGLVEIFDGKNFGRPVVKVRDL